MMYFGISEKEVTSHWPSKGNGALFMEDVAFGQNLNYKYNFLF